MHLMYHDVILADLLDLGNNDQTPGKDIYNAEVMLQHKSNRWHQSVEINPLFFNSAFGGLVVTTAAERYVFNYLWDKPKSFPEIKYLMTWSLFF